LWTQTTGDGQLTTDHGPFFAAKNACYPDSRLSNILGSAAPTDLTLTNERAAAASTKVSLKGKIDL